MDHGAACSFSQEAGSVSRMKTGGCGVGHASASLHLRCRELRFQTDGGTQVAHIQMVVFKLFIFGTVVDFVR